MEVAKTAAKPADKQEKQKTQEEEENTFKLHWDDTVERRGLGRKH